MGIEIIFQQKHEILDYKNAPFNLDNSYYFYENLRLSNSKNGFPVS